MSGTRKAVNGVSRSGRPIGPSIIISDSTSASASPEPARAPPLKSPRSKRQQSTRSSMNQDYGLDVETALNQTPTGYKVHAEQVHITKPHATELPSHVSKSFTNTGADSNDVEEYTFTSEEEFDEDEDAMEDVRSHISLSSDDPPEDDYSIDTRPWLSMNREQRREYETMFLMITHPAVGQSWSYTEDYQTQVDNMMLLYMQDFPLPTWIHGQLAAEKAFEFYHERSKWRQLGIRIYAAERLPDIFQPRTSYPVPPPAAQPMPSRPSSNDLPRQNPQQRPTVKFAEPPSRTAPVVDPPAEPAKTTKHSMPVDQRMDTFLDERYANVLKNAKPADIEKRIEEMINDSVPKLLAASPDPTKPTQTHAHPPRPRPHQTPSKTTAKAAQKKTKDAESPAPRPITPPYPARPRPVDRRPHSKTGKKPARKPAEAEEFAWNRDIDFRTAAEESTWRDDIYDPETLRIMAEVRKHNEPIIERLDQEVTEKQRISRNFRRKQLATEGATDPQARPGRKKKDPNDKSDNNDPYHAGYFAFAQPEMLDRARKLGCMNALQVIKAGENDKISLEELHTFKLTWNPGRKGLTYDLIQAPFSAKDTVLTRKQLASTLILNRRAAECIIDFSPDLLWRDILLRICSEAGCGNKDVRERFCLNGCHADKATFTKRISAALGQKQTQGKSKGYAPGEWEFYEASGEDFKNYIEFFGKRSTTRNMKVGLKRRYADGGGADGDQSRAKRAKVEDDDGADTSVSIVASDDVAMGEEEGDAVSAQDSDALDMMSD